MSPPRTHALSRRGAGEEVGTDDRMLSAMLLCYQQKNEQKMNG